MTTNEPQLPEQELSPDELAALLDSLMAAGTQHVNLATGVQTTVQTVNSTECCQNGACKIPTLGKDDEF